MEDSEFEKHIAASSKANKGRRFFKHLCRGLFLVYIVRLGLSFTNEGCNYYDENGDEIIHGYSLHKGYATQIRFRKKLYETQKGEEQKLLEAANKCGSFAGFHTYAKLKDGKILVAGSNVDFYDMTDGTWLCDPKSAKTYAGPKMTAPCINPTLTSLKDGRILLTGGFRDDKSGPIDTISVFDPATATIKQIGKLSQARGEHTCLQVNAKQVLVVGGRVERYSLANPGKTTGIVELIDLSSGKSKVLQFIEAGAAPIVIRDDNKDIFAIGGFYATETMGDTRWHSKVTRLNIPREDVD